MTGAQLWPHDDLWHPLAAVTRFANARPFLSNLLGVLAIDAATVVPLIVGNENRWWVWLLHQSLVLPLVARRRWPVPVFALLACLALAQWLANVPLAADISLPVALYTVSVQCPRREAQLAAGVLEIGVVLASVRFAPASDGLAGSLVFLTGLVIAALFGGIAVRSHVAYLASVVDRAAQLERERDQQTRLATTEERTRIAREMHDIVAHSLSVVVALSDGAALSNHGGSREATDAMRQASSVGREALTEMRRLLGVLRDDSVTVPALAPQPGLDRIGSLLNDVRATGLAVDLETSGAPRDIPPTADATAYRIVQESLTNTLKHASNATRVIVEITWRDDSLALQVTDDGVTCLPRDPVAGHGLMGMSERAALFDGTVSAGPVTGRGWQVTAILPLAS